MFKQMITSAAIAITAIVLAACNESTSIPAPAPALKNETAQLKQECAGDDGSACYMLVGWNWKLVH
jgi:hypothetical protein